MIKFKPANSQLDWARAWLKKRLMTQYQKKGIQKILYQGRLITKCERFDSKNKVVLFYDFIYINFLDKWSSNNYFLDQLSKGFYIYFYTLPFSIILNLYFNALKLCPSWKNPPIPKMTLKKLKTSPNQNTLSPKKSLSQSMMNSAQKKISLIHSPNFVIGFSLKKISSNKASLNPNRRYKPISRTVMSWSTIHTTKQELLKTIDKPFSNKKSSLVS